MQQRDESEEYTDPPQDFRTWCEKNNVLWKLAEEIDPKNDLVYKQ